MVTEDEKLSKIHMLPCHISYDGPAEVDSFFTQRIKMGKDGSPTAFFRGRELKGMKVLLHDASVNLPIECSNDKENMLTDDDMKKQTSSQLTGIVLEKGVGSGTDHVKMNVRGSFNELTVWQHDRVPEENHFSKHLYWFEIATSMHAP